MDRCQYDNYGKHHDCEGGVIGANAVVTQDTQPMGIILALLRAGCETDEMVDDVRSYA